MMRVYKKRCIGCVCMLLLIWIIFSRLLNKDNYSIDSPLSDPNDDEFSFELQIERKDIADEDDDDMVSDKLLESYDDDADIDVNTDERDQDEETFLKTIIL
ncbi:unnamed protein product [Owenia fusiformis]|uniref:Uncharacterized protein n=1 Tax=Owenia fusiformis TaxID=6347 RepID=A0A8S4NW05_OWEFU|nr:unnamed protein product [Owenia fusiformis]